jgi:D-alanyl-D-alanine carboxypeptidase
MQSTDKKRSRSKLKIGTNRRPALSPKKTIKSIRYDIALPLASSSSWSIVSADDGQLLWGKNEDEVRDMASLTKMMTCLMTTQLVNEQLCSLETPVKVSRKASKMNGTSAFLREADQLRVVDCLHAMMLPSGNDAAKALSENLGALLKPMGCRETDSEHFVKRMNFYAKQLGLHKTRFSNPHGLAHRGNRSTARELGKVAAFLLNDPISKEIVGCCEYTCRVVNQEDCREVTWKNTNSLLDEETCTGVKTGITPNAGPCLCASFRLEEGHVVGTILNCKTASRRWDEVKALMEWARSQLRGLKVT